MERFPPAETVPWFIKRFTVSEQILVVEDSKVVGYTLKRKIESKLGMKVDSSPSYERTRELLESRNGDYFMAVLDLSLPDAPHGEVVDLVTSYGIPSIILTATVDEAIRREFFKKHIADYFLKEGEGEIDQIVEEIRMIRRNHENQILVVDDSATFRSYVVELLRRRRYTVFQASGGDEALALLEHHPDIKLMIVDYSMPDMDGFHLIRTVRRTRGKDSLAIIGLSAAGSGWVTSKFLKFGANDYLRKPFGIEEFYCRLTQNLELVELVGRIKESSNTDFLTNLFNRKYLEETGHKLVERSLRGGLHYAFLMLDIDHFKNINDTYGHAVGDAALKHLAVLIKGAFRPDDLVCRWGGEEFCVLFGPIEPEIAARKAEGLRAAVDHSQVSYGGKIYEFTVSIGLTGTHAGDSLETMQLRADKLLYKAKHNGRNQLVTDFES